MPISKENRARYPDDWDEISARIRFERAGGRCECLGECGTNHALDSDPHLCAPAAPVRCTSVHGLPHQSTGSIVVLTTGHLNHTPEECDDENLRAWCQSCHNRYDQEHRQANAAATRRARKASGDLFR